RTSAPALRLPSALRRCCVYCDGARRDLHSFPTRRSSDLGAERPAPFTAAGADKLVVLAGVVQHQDVVDHDLQPVGLGIDHDGDIVLVGAVQPEVLDGDAREAAGGVADIDQQTLAVQDRKSTRLNSSHVKISYAVFCLKKK